MPDVDPAANNQPAPESAPVVPEGTPAAPAEVDEFAPLAAEPDTFPRDYVHKLRESGAKYRTERNDLKTRIGELEPLAGAFSGWEPDQVQGWTEFLSTAQTDPQGALKALLGEGFGLDKEGASALLTEMFGDEGAPAAPQGAPAAGDDPNRPLTIAEYEARQQAAREESAQQGLLREVQDEAKALGYDPASKAGSLEEFSYQRLLYIAGHQTGGDLSKAHEALVAERQQIAKDALAQMASQADGLPVPSGAGAAGAAVDNGPKTFANADELARQALASRS